MYQGKPSLYFKHFPDCTFEEFHAATGSPKQTWYDSRDTVIKIKRDF
jgi:hypothetical protein